MEAEISLRDFKSADDAIDAESLGTRDTSGSEDEEQETTKNGHKWITHEKRERKKVQRLSETLNRVHEEIQEKRAKATELVMKTLEAGKGVELGSIPLIEATIRKTKPVNLKPLHLIIYGRLGSVSDVRSNLRKFHGFSFQRGSPEYAKKLNYIEQRPTNEIRESLRILNLETSGTRQLMASRLLEFLARPQAAMVKYCGKVVKKPGKDRKKSGHTSKAKRKPTHKASSIKTGSSEVSCEDDTNRTDDPSDGSDSISSIEDEEEESSADEKPKRAAPKRGRSSKVQAAPKRRAVIDSDEAEDSQETKKSVVDPKRGSSASEDEDVPLSSLAPPKKPTVPSDNELKDNIISLLKTVNLEETSLKVVREQIFARYPGVDLSNKKEFINTTVKEYLAQS